jgi:hypothetical protein
VWAGEKKKLLRFQATDVGGMELAGDQSRPMHKWNVAESWDYLAAY